MDYTTWTLPPQPQEEADPLCLQSLYETLQGLTDRRRAQGKRYSLAFILCLLIVAKLAGQQTLSGATEWIRHRGKQFAQRFGLERETMPCQMTYCKVLARVESQQLDELLSAFFVRWEAQSRCGEEPSRLQSPQVQADHAHLAIDGKTLRATTGEAQPVHQLSCYEVATGIVLWHCEVGAKENEISALKPLLTPQMVKGRIFTLDAMHTQRWLCAQIHRLGGDYVLVAKDNQPTLRADIADLLEDLTPDRRRWRDAQTIDQGHGRLEARHITCSPDLNDWFGNAWEGIEQVFRLERTVRILKTNQVRHEVVYGLSSLSMRQAPPARMLALVREHWAIENCVHWVLDLAFREDESRVRLGHADENLAVLRHISLNLLRREPSSRVGIHTKRLKADWDNTYLQHVLAGVN